MFTTHRRAASISGFAVLVLALGCGKQSTDVGDRASLNRIKGQNVGIVLRVERYVYGRHPGRTIVREGQLSTDSPTDAYSLAKESLKTIVSLR